MSKAAFQNKLASTAEEPLLFVLAASWCGYCLRFLQLAKEFPSEEQLFLVDADSENEILWEELRLRLVPTLIVIQAGKEIFRQDGRSNVGLLKGDLERAIAATRKPIN